VNSTPSATGSEGEVLSWSVSPERERWLTVLSYGMYAALWGFVLILAGAAVIVGIALTLEGSWGVVLVGAAVAAVLAFVRPPVVAALRSGSLGPDEDVWQPSRRGQVVAAVVGAAILAPAFVFGQEAGVAVAVLLGGASLLAMTLQTEATIDGLQLETRGASVDLAGLSRVRTLSLGGLTVFWLQYARGADSFGNPRVLAATTEQAPQVRDRLQRGVDAPTNAEPIGPVERAIVALFGLNALAVAPAFWFLAGSADGGPLVVVYMAAFSMVFAGPMLWYAWKG
jgi:hypothetical protein